MPVSRPAMHTKTAAYRQRRHERVRFIVLHETIGSYPSDLDYLASRNDRKVSVDFYINRTGGIWQLNPDVAGHHTWHAGRSSYQGYSGLNTYSVGIEMERAEEASDWPAAQVAAAAHLSAWLTQEFGLDLSTHPIVGHARIAPDRKTDPRNFPWEDFSSRVRALLGEGAQLVTLIWGPTERKLQVELLLIDGSYCADADALVAASGLSLKVAANADGLVAVRGFFEANGCRVDWDDATHRITAFPKSG